MRLRMVNDTNANFMNSNCILLQAHLFVCLFRKSERNRKPRQRWCCCKFHFT